MVDGQPKEAGYFQGVGRLDGAVVAAKDHCNPDAQKTASPSSPAPPIPQSPAADVAPTSAWNSARCESWSAPPGLIGCPLPRSLHACHTLPIID